MHAANATSPGTRRRTTQHDQWGIALASDHASWGHGCSGHSPTAATGRRWDLVGRSHGSGQDQVGPSHGGGQDQVGCSHDSGQDLVKQPNKPVYRALGNPTRGKVTCQSNCRR